MKQGLIVGLFGAIMAGCGLVEAITHKQALTVYAEDLFRRQNKLTSQLMMLDSTVENEEALYQAEMAMHEACKLLNDYARYQMEGKSLGILFKRRVKNSLPACEDAIVELEECLEDSVE
jgi:hypothetical protein